MVKQITIQMLQGSSLTINTTPTIRGLLIPEISAANFIVYKGANTVLSKTLGSGVSFLNGTLSVDLEPEDTLDLLGSYYYEIVLQTSPVSKTYFAAKGIFDIIATLGRID